MRKLIALVGSLLILLGLQLDTRWHSLPLQGAVLTVFYADHIATYEYDQVGYFRNFGNAVSQRIDFDGQLDDAINMLEILDAKIKLREKIDQISIIYAYSPHLPTKKNIHGKSVNIMVAVSAGKVSMGYPLLDGSF